MNEYPPLTVRFECNICMIEFSRTFLYERDKEEYERFKDMVEKVKELENKDEILEELIFVDICNDCRKK